MPVTIFKTGAAALHDANQVAKLYGWAIPDKDLQAAYQQLPIKNSKELAVDGKMLITKAGIKPGPLMGKIIQQLTTTVINGKITNDPVALLNEAQKIMKEG